MSTFHSQTPQPRSVFLATQPSSIAAISFSISANHYQMLLVECLCSNHYFVFEVLLKDLFEIMKIAVELIIDLPNLFFDFAFLYKDRITKYLAKALSFS